MLFQDVVFWILAVMAIVGALGVVLLPNLFRAALLLIVVFVAVAGMFILLSAEFLAVVQILIYVGAIAILIIFAVMLTRDVQRGNLPNRMHIPAAVFAALLLAALVAVAVDTEWNFLTDDQQERVELVQVSAVTTLTVEALDEAGVSQTEQKEMQESGLADLLISDYVLPFEAVSVLLLAALIGALVLVRPNPGTGRGELRMSFEAFLIVAAILFCIGLYGALARRNVLAVLMSIELMFNAVNVTLVAMAKYLAPAGLMDDISTVLTGQVFAVFIITVAAAEIALGLGIVFAMYRTNETVDLSEATQLRN